MDLSFRKVIDSDRKQIVDIFTSIVRKGGTYVFHQDSQQLHLEDYWFHASHTVYTAILNHKIVGSFWLCSNYPDHGSHIANAAYIVSPDQAGRGIGLKMAEYSLEEAKRLGFEGIQFNYVLRNNATAVRLWEKIGFSIIGTIPNGYKNVKSEYSDVYIMFKALN